MMRIRVALVFLVPTMFALALESCGSDDPPAAPVTNVGDGAPNDALSASDAPPPSLADGAPIILSPYCTAFGQARLLCNLPYDECEQRACQTLERLYSDGYKQAFITCHTGATTCSNLRDGGDPNDTDRCVFQGISKAGPTPAHRQVVAHFCANCPGEAEASALCQSKMFGEADTGQPNANGQALLIVSDELAMEIDAKCTTTAVLAPNPNNDFCDLPFNQCLAAIHKSHAPPSCKKDASP